MSSLLYPSVTVCKKYTFDRYIDDIFYNESLTLAEVAQTANDKSWDVEELFYFFTQPNKLNARQFLILFPSAFQVLVEDFLNYYFSKFFQSNVLSCYRKYPKEKSPNRTPFAKFTIVRNAE